MVITLIAAAVVVLVPGVAAAWWTRRLTGGIEHGEDQSLEPGQLIGLVYAGLGVAVIALWLGSVAFGLSGWTSVAMPLGVTGVLALDAVRGSRASGRVAGAGHGWPRTRLKGSSRRARGGGARRGEASHRGAVDGDRAAPRAGPGRGAAPPFGDAEVATMSATTSAATGRCLVLPQSTVGVLSLTYLHARVWAVV